jgi:hypothetical protein
MPCYTELVGASLCFHARRHTCSFVDVGGVLVSLCSVEKSPQDDSDEAAIGSVK